MHIDAGGTTLTMSGGQVVQVSLSAVKDAPKEDSAGESYENTNAPKRWFFQCLDRLFEEDTATSASGRRFRVVSSKPQEWNDVTAYWTGVLLEQD